MLVSARVLAMAETEVSKPGPKHRRAVDVAMAFEAFVHILRGCDDVDFEAICRRHTYSKGRSALPAAQAQGPTRRLCYRH